VKRDLFDYTPTPRRTFDSVSGRITSGPDYPSLLCSCLTVRALGANCAGCGQPWPLGVPPGAYATARERLKLGPPTEPSILGEPDVQVAPCLVIPQEVAQAVQIVASSGAIAIWLAKGLTALRRLWAKRKL